jgi:hypothetical protein
VPRSEQSLVITDRYRAQLARLTDLTRGSVTQAWQAILDPADIAGSHDRWMQRALAVIEGAQRVGITLTDAYIRAYLASELASRAIVQPVVQDPLVGQAAEGAGRGLATALIGAKVATLIAIREGSDFPDALATGLARAERTTHRAVLAAPRMALHEHIKTDGRIIGWRRVTSGGCGACLGDATGAIRPDDSFIDVHDGCQCSSEPVVRNAPDRATRPTGSDIFQALPRAEQDQRLGPEAARQVRDGEIPLSALISFSPMQHMPDQLTQAPVGA